VTTPIFDALVQELGDPNTPPKVFPINEKRKRHKAGRLTAKVWQAICANPQADTSAITDTQEIPRG
jgi:hypothetical protein